MKMTNYLSNASNLYGSIGRWLGMARAYYYSVPVH
jgi:hypothetical protein